MARAHLSNSSTFLSKTFALPVLLLFTTVFSATVLPGSIDEIGISANNAISLNGKLAVLYGVSVPIARSKCLEGEDLWPCGGTATLRFNELVSNPELQCTRVDSIPDQELVRCRIGELDVAEKLISEGWAVTVSGSDTYSDHERSAKFMQLGVWRKGFNPPSDWRNYPQTTIDAVEDLQCSVCAIRKQN